MDWNTFVRISHVIGTVLGAGGATFAEIFYLKAVKDGHVDPYESSTLKTVFYVIRIGMIILVLSGFGFLILARLQGYAEQLYSPRLWAKLTITLILLLSVVYWQAKRPKMALGSAISLTSWYAATIIGVWRGLDSYIVIMTFYVLAVFAVALGLLILRRILGIKI